MTFTINTRRDGTICVSAEDALGRINEIAITPVVTALKLDVRCPCGDELELRHAPDSEVQLFCFGCHRAHGRLKLGMTVC
jgi:hypothetical protein